ncbi:1-phosphofructokinase family hexose kinase [Sutcliffiella sp. NPDC057660]|uniref:1-phosphofructokinase family hexose kinase n=1 Tax=Sutcliffiella sp. NPDC057660 TaxID=3346199 RepID=UPI0036C440DC
MITTVTLNAAIDKTYWISPFQMGKTNRISKQRVEPGGKGVNAAKVLSSLGVNVTVTGFVGGTSGSELKRLLSVYPIQQRWKEVAGETRTCLNLIDESQSMETELLEKGLQINQEDWKGFKELLKTITAGSSLVLLSGSLPDGLGSGAYRELVSMIRNMGISVGVDASGSAFRDCIASRPTIIKPNIHELEEYCGKPLVSQKEIIEEASKIYKKGISYVFVSMGKDGAIGISNDGIYRARIAPIQAVNTIGCGDATFAGMALVLERSEDVVKALKSGMAAGMANALSEGAGIVIRKDYERFYENIAVEKIEEVSG